MKKYRNKTTKNRCTIKLKQIYVLNWYENEHWKFNEEIKNVTFTYCCFGSKGNWIELTAAEKLKNVNET